MNFNRRIQGYIKLIFWWLCIHLVHMSNWLQNDVETGTIFLTFAVKYTLIWITFPNIGMMNRYNLHKNPIIDWFASNSCLFGNKAMTGRSESLTLYSVKLYTCKSSQSKYYKTVPPLPWLQSFHKDVLFLKCPTAIRHRKKYGFPFTSQKYWINR